MMPYEFFRNSMINFGSIDLTKVLTELIDPILEDLKDKKGSHE